LEKPTLDGLLVIVLADHSNAVITERQAQSFQRGLRDRRKEQPAPLIELGEEFLGTQHRARRGMRLYARRGADHDSRIRDPNALAHDPRELLISGVRQIINSRATPRTSISKSSPCTGGRAKCHVKPPEMAPRRTNSSAMRRWMSKIV